jgi:hypothetical protein
VLAEAATVSTGSASSLPNAIVSRNITPAVIAAATKKSTNTFNLLLLFAGE